MALGQLALALTISGGIHSSFDKTTKTVAKKLATIDSRFNKINDTKIATRKFDKLAQSTTKNKIGVDRLDRSLAKAADTTQKLAGKTNQLATELGKVNKLSQIDFKLNGVKQQFAQAKSQVLGTVAAGYSLGRVYSSAANVLKAQGELATLAMSEKGINDITKAGQAMALQFGQISAPQFIKASYDIKSGIASLSESGVKDFTRMAGMTAVATKSSVEVMTKLFALGYGIFSKDFASDVAFGQQFSGAIAAAVQAFKTDGSDLSQGLANIGSDAKAMGVSLAEELAIIGIAKEGLNSASEAGTKYRAFLAGAGKAQKDLGLSFTDSQGKLLPMVEILNLIKAKYGDTIDVAEKLELDKAFGSNEATGLLISLIGKTDKLTQSQTTLQQAMQGGMTKAEQMAKAANRGYGFEKLGHAFSYIGFTLGKTLAPAVNLLAGGIGSLATGVAWLDHTFPVLVPTIMGLTAALASLFIISSTVKLAKLTLQFANLSLAKSYNNLAVKVLPLATTAFKTLNVAMLSNPIGLIATALMTAAIIIYKYWQPIKAFFSGMFTGFAQSITPVIAAFKPFVSLLSPLTHLLGSIWQQIANVASWFGQLLTPVTLAENQLTQLTSTGKTFGTILATAFKVAFAPLILGAKAIGWLGEKMGLLENNNIATTVTTEENKKTTRLATTKPVAIAGSMMLATQAAATPIPTAIPQFELPIQQQQHASTPAQPISQTNTLYITVNNPAADIDIERAIITALRKQDNVSFTDEDI